MSNEETLATAVIVTWKGNKGAVQTWRDEVDKRLVAALADIQQAIGLQN